MLRLLGEDDGEVSEWLQKKSNKYTSPDIQNDLIAILTIRVLRSITALLQESPFLAVMIDETTDITNQEQVAIVIRRIDANLRYAKNIWGFIVFLLLVLIVFLQSLKTPCYGAICQ